MLVVVEVEEVDHVLEGRARLSSSSRWRSLRSRPKKLLQRQCWHWSSCAQCTTGKAGTAVFFSLSASLCRRDHK